jgi:hypothetical protein
VVHGRRRDVYTVAFVEGEMRLIVREDGWRKWVPEYELIPAEAA